MMKAARKIHAGNTDCSCTSCLYKSTSDNQSLGRLIVPSNRIERLYFGQYIPLRERKLIDKLVRTRAVYDDIRAKLISDSTISLNKKTDPKTKNKRNELDDNEKDSGAVLELIDLVDKGATLECCSCCSCSSKEHLQPHRKPKHRRSYTGSRRQVIQKNRLDAHATKKGVRFKAKHIRSDPCTCTFKFSELIKNKKNIPMELDLQPITKKTQPSKQEKVREIVRRSYENIKQSRKQIEEKVLEEIKKVKESKANIQERLQIDVQASAVKLKQTRNKLKSKVKTAPPKKLSKDNLQLNDLLAIRLFPEDKIFEMPAKESLLDVITQKSKEKIIQAKNKLKSAMKPTLDRKTKTTKIITKTSGTDFAPENDIANKVKKDSIRKFQEELRRKQIMKDWECDPECIDESCVPEECFIKLQRKRKNMKHRVFDHHTRKYEKKTGPVLIQKNEKIQYKALAVQAKNINQKRTVKAKKIQVHKQKIVSPEDIKLGAKEKMVSPIDIKLVPQQKIVSSKDKKLVSKEKIVSPKDKSIVSKEKIVSPKNLQLVPKEKIVSPEDIKLVRKSKIVSPNKKSSSGQGVRIKSSFSFEIDFYKQKPNMTSQESDIPKPAPSGIKYNIMKKPKVKNHLRNSQVLIKHSSRDTQTEIRSLKRCFCNLKLKSKMSKPKHKKKQKVTTAEKSITALESPGAPCKEVDCSAEICEKTVCEKLMLSKLSNTNTTKKIKKKRDVKLRYLLPYECEPGVCTPGNCDPYQCIKLINIRKTKNKESSVSCISPPRKTKSTSTFTSKSTKASKAKIAQSLYTYGNNQKNNQEIPKLERKYVHNTYGRQAVKIKSTFSFNIEFYKNKTPQHCPQPSDLKTFVIKPKLKEIPNPKLKERAYQGDVPSIHKNILTQIHKKKRDESLSTSLKRCFCTLKLQRKSHPKLKRKRMSSTGTKTTEEQFMNIVTLTKATKTKQKHFQLLEPYECEPFTCIPGECNPYECLERINRRNLRDVGVSSTFYRSEINKGSSTSEKILKAVKTQSKPRSKEQKVLTKVKKPKRRTQTLKEKVSYAPSAPSKQAVKIGSTFSFNVEFYKKQLPIKDLKTNYQIRPDIKLDTRPTTRNTGVKIEKLNVAHLDTQIEEIKKRNKTSTTKPLLKRCFCTLNLQKNNVRTNPLKLSGMKPKVYTVNRAVVKQNSLSIFRTHCTRNICSSRSANANMNSTLTSQLSVIKSLYNECRRLNSIKHLECLSCYPLIINKNKLEIIKSNFNTALNLISQSRISDNLKLGETGNLHLAKGSNNVNQYLSYVNQERKCVDYPSNNFNDENGHQSGLRQYLKGYYCTMNLQVVRNKYRRVQTNIHSNIGNRGNQKPRKLKPYECEPGVCVPGECDPYECLKLISKRDSKKIGTPNTVTDTSSYTSFKYKTNKIQSPKTTKSYLSKSIGINKQSFSNQLTQSPFRKSVQKASATLPRMKRCFCTLKLQKKGRLQKKEHKQPSESIQTEAPFPQPTTIDRGQNPHKFKPLKMSSLEPYECQPGICIPGQCNPYECLEIMNKLNYNQTADSGSDAIIEKSKTSGSMTVSELKYKTRRVNAKPRVISGSNLSVTPTALRDQESQNKSTTLAVSTMTTSFMKRCFCVLKLRKNKVKKNDTNAVEIMNKPVTMDKKTNTEHYEERIFQLEPYECEPGTCIPGECDPYVCEKIIKRRNNLRSQSSSTALNSARAVSSICPTTCRKNVNTQLRPIKSTSETKNQFYMKIKQIKQRNSETKSPTVSFRSQISQIIVNKRDFAASINNVIKRCFCTLQLYNRRKESKKKIQKPIEKKVHSKSVMTTEKNRVNFDSLEPYECEPNVCTPYECDPYECEKRIKLRQRKQHQREIGMLTQHSNQHTAANTTEFFNKSQKGIQSMSIKNAPVLKLDQKVQFMDVHSTIARPTPPLKRCFCTFHLKRPKEEPASIPKPKMSNVSTETKIRGLKPVTKLLPYECEPNICVPGECNPLECLERIKRRSKQKDYGTSTKNIPKYELGISMVTNKTINRRSQFKSSGQQNSGNQSYYSKQNSKISTEKPFLKRCFCTLKLQKKPARKVSKASVKTDTNDIPKVSKPKILSIDRGTLTKSKKKNIQLGPYECEPNTCIPDECDPYECQKRIAARNLKSKNVSTQMLKPFSQKSVGMRLANTVSKKMQSNPFSILPKKSQVNKQPTIVEIPRFGNAFNKQAVKIGSNFSFNIEFYKEMLPPTAKKYSKYDKIERFQPRKTKHSKVYNDSIKTSTLAKYQNKGIQGYGVKKDDKALEVGNALKRCFCTLKLQKELNSKQSKLKLQNPQYPQVIEVRRVSVKKNTKQTLTEVKSVATKAKAKYINASCNPRICLQNLSPEEMEVIFPYTPSKFNKTPSKTMQNRELYNKSNTKPRKTKITNRGKRLTKKHSKKSMRTTHLFDKDVNPLHHSITKFKKMVCRCVLLFLKKTEPGYLVNSTVKQLNNQSENESSRQKKKSKLHTMGKTKTTKSDRRSNKTQDIAQTHHISLKKNKKYPMNNTLDAISHKNQIMVKESGHQKDDEKTKPLQEYSHNEMENFLCSHCSKNIKMKKRHSQPLKVHFLDTPINKNKVGKKTKAKNGLALLNKSVDQIAKHRKSIRKNNTKTDIQSTKIANYCKFCVTCGAKLNNEEIQKAAGDQKSLKSENKKKTNPKGKEDPSQHQQVSSNYSQPQLDSSNNSQPQQVSSNKSQRQQVSSNNSHGLRVGSKKSHRQQASSNKSQRHQMSSNKSHGQRVSSNNSPPQQISSKNSQRQEVRSKNSQRQEVSNNNQPQQVSSNKSQRKQVGMKNSHGEQASSKNSQRQEVSSKNSQRQEVSSKNSQRQEVSSKKSQRQQVSSNNSQPQQVGSNKSQRKQAGMNNNHGEQASRKNSQRQEVSSKNSQRQEVSSKNSQRQEVSSKKSQRQQVSSNNSQPQQVGSNKSQRKQAGMNNNHGEQASRKNSQPQQVSSKNSQRQEVSSKNSQRQEVSSNKSQRQQVSGNNSQPQQVGSNKSQRKQAGMNNNYGEQASRKNSQPQQVSSKKSQRQEVSSKNSQRQEVISNNIQNKRVISKKSERPQVNSNNIQDKQVSSKNSKRQFQQVMYFTRDKIKNLFLRCKQSDDNICSAKGPQPPLFEMHLDSDDYGILNKDEVLDKIKKFSKKSVKGRPQDQPFYKRHGESCSCCICLARKNKTGATFSVRPKGTKETKAGRAFGKRFGKKKCVCGSVLCAEELARMGKKKGTSKHRPLICDCGSPVCASELKTMKAIAAAKDDVTCICAIERERMLNKLREKKNALKMKKRAQRLKQLEKEDKIRNEERRRRNKIMEKKVNRNSTDVILAAESLIDIGKLGISACTDILRLVARTAIDPKQAYKNLKAIKENPEILLKKFSSGLNNGGLASTYRRVRLRCLSMRGVKTVKDSLERHAFTNYVLYMFAKDPKKRIAKRQPREREQLDFNCSLFMGSLRKKPHLSIYNRCPWFYPHFVSLINIWKQFMEISLFLIAVLVWSPCILCMEACRAFMCCFLCTG